MGPTPLGVPVAITSPGSRVITEDTKLIISGTGNIRSAVVPCWFQFAVQIGFNV
jgi:hypothetical protein